MGLKHKFTTTFVKYFGKPRIKRLHVKQRSLNTIPAALRPTSNSPTRFEIPLEMMNLIQERDDIEMRHIFPFRRLSSIIKNIHISVDTITQNPTHPNSRASEAFARAITENEYFLIFIQ